MSNSRRSPRHLRLAPLFALAALAAIGCQADDAAVDPSGPSLTVVGSNICGRNILPVTEVENVREGKYITLDLVATGIDPATPSREMTEGTTVEFVIDEATTTGRAFFVTKSDDDFASGPRPMTGRTAREQVYCVGQGDVYVHARVTDYQPNGEGIAETVTTLRAFPIRCIDAVQYQDTCGPVDFGPGVAPTDDMGIDEGVADAGDAEPDAAPILSPWTVRYLPPDDVEGLILSVRGSAGTRPDNTILQFKVLEGATPIAGVPVLFEITGADGAGGGLPGGVQLRAEPESPGTREEVQADAEYADQYQQSFDGDIDDDESAQYAVTDASGTVTVRVIAGRVAGSLSVRAVAFRNEQLDWDRSRALIIRGGIPSQYGFDLDCDDTIIPGFSHREYDPDIDVQHYGLGHEVGTQCRVQLVDILGGRIDREQRVFFLTEAGSVDQEAGLDEEGGATTMLRVGQPPPKDVEPEAWEEPFVNPNTHRDVVFNPRDGLVRIVAFTRGEEDFNDLNGNLIFDGIDTQEPGQKLAEPYLDANDNGTRDADERFRDSDGNGLWYSPQIGHTWRASTDIWTSTTVLWTGDLRTDLEQNAVQLAECNAAEGCFTEGGPGECAQAQAPLNFDLGGAMVLEGTFLDDNGNCLGGRGQGEVTLTPPADMIVEGEFLTRGLSGQFCWAGFERPRGKTFRWTMVNATTENEDALTVDLSYQSLRGDSHSISWSFGVCR
jgi:hypothetical protein